VSPRRAIGWREAHSVHFDVAVDVVKSDEDASHDLPFHLRGVVRWPNIKHCLPKEGEYFLTFDTHLLASHIRGMAKQQVAISDVLVFHLLVLPCFTLLFWEMLTLHISGSLGSHTDRGISPALLKQQVDELGLQRLAMEGDLLLLAHLLQLQLVGLIQIMGRSSLPQQDPGDRIRQRTSSGSPGHQKMSS
jgi:hypothetical protein